MPLYGSQVTSGAQLTVISPDDPSFLLFNAESPTTGQRSIAVVINHNTARVIRGIALELIFSANPGTFNFQIQGSDTEANNGSAYFTEGSGTITTATAENDGTYRARVELSPWVAQFLALLINTQTSNAVTVTAKAKVF